MEILVIISIIAVSGVIILLLREFNCWYLKINERIQLLKSIDAKLGQLSLEKESPKPEQYKNHTWVCPKCGMINPPENLACTKCKQKYT